MQITYFDLITVSLSVGCLSFYFGLFFEMRNYRKYIHDTIIKVDSIYEKISNSSKSNDARMLDVESRIESLEMMVHSKR